MKKKKSKMDYDKMKYSKLRSELNKTISERKITN